MRMQWTMRSGEGQPRCGLGTFGADRACLAVVLSSSQLPSVDGSWLALWMQHKTEVLHKGRVPHEHVVSCGRFLRLTAVSSASCCMWTSQELRWTLVPAS